MFSTEKCSFPPRIPPRASSTLDSLLPHIPLAIIALPLILITFFLSLTGRFPAHRKLARWTFPIWLYVSVSGVVVYAMLAAYR